VRSSLEGVLGDEGFDVRTVETGEAALDEAAGGAFDAVLLDVWLPGIDGLETLQGLRERSVDAEVVMISGHGTIETAVRATKLGAFDFVEKPLSLEKTLLVVRNALRTRRLERRNLALLEQLARDTEIVAPPRRCSGATVRPAASGSRRGERCSWTVSTVSNPISRTGWLRNWRPPSSSRGEPGSWRPRSGTASG
jgi:DNA-binding response OmpR family regulator